MRLSRPHPAIRTLCLLALLAVWSPACGGSDELPAPDATQATESDATLLGKEIGETYLLLMADAKAMLELDLPAEQLRSGLRFMASDYRVRFANLGCLRQALGEDDQLEATRAADAEVFAGGGQDTRWLSEAAQRYGGDPELTQLLTELPAVRLYAFFDQLARVRPGEHVLCN